MGWYGIRRCIIALLLHTFFFWLHCLGHWPFPSCKLCIFKWIHGPSLEAKAIRSFAELETNDKAASYPGFFIKLSHHQKVDLRDGKVLDWAPSTRSKVAIRKWRMQISFQTFIWTLTSDSFPHSLTLSPCLLVFSTRFPTPRPRAEGVTGIHCTWNHE